MLNEFLTTSFQNVRSSKRTDELHKVLLDEVLNNNPDWAEYTWQFEYQLTVDGFGGTFDIDIAGFKNGELRFIQQTKSEILAEEVEVEKTQHKRHIGIVNEGLGELFFGKNKQRKPSQ